MLSKNVEKYLRHGVDSIIKQTGRPDSPDHHANLVNKARIGVVNSWSNRSEEFNNRQSEIPGLVFRLKIEGHLVDGLYCSICSAENNQYKIAEILFNAIEYADKMMKNVDITIR